MLAAQLCCVPQPAFAAKGAVCSRTKILECLHPQACCTPSTDFAGNCVSSYEFYASTAGCSACCRTGIRHDPARYHSWQVWSSAVTGNEQPPQQACCSVIISCSITISCNASVLQPLSLRETRPCSSGPWLRCMVTCGRHASGGCSRHNCLTWALLHPVFSWQQSNLHHCLQTQGWSCESSAWAAQRHCLEHVLCPGAPGPPGWALPGGQVAAQSHCIQPVDQHAGRGGAGPGHGEVSTHVLGMPHRWGQPVNMLDDVKEALSSGKRGTTPRSAPSMCPRACGVHGCRSCDAKGCAAVRSFLSA